MAKKINWTFRASNDRKQILRYWTIRNKSDRYSITLRQKIKSALVSVSKNPEIGQQYNLQNIRYVVLKDYKIFYFYTKDSINVIAIWDTRRNPDKLKVK